MKKDKWYSVGRVDEATLKKVNRLKAELFKKKGRLPTNCEMLQYMVSAALKQLRGGK